MKNEIKARQQETQWIEMARKGDLSAFNQLVLAYQDVLVRMALWMLNNEANAEDIVQSVFLSAYRSIHIFRSGTFRGWLLKMVRNACIDELRRRKRHPWFPLEPQDRNGEEIETAMQLVDPENSPEDVLIQHEEWNRIEQSLWELSKPMRDVIVLIDIEGLDYQEAATILCIPVGTIKSRLARARLRLREILRNEQEEVDQAVWQDNKVCMA